MELTVVLLNWNAAEDTIACLRPLRQWHQLQPTLIVVDNASTDDSVAQITAQLPTVHLIQNKQNLGFSGGTNRGIELALSLSDAPILLLNNDAAIDEADACRMVQTLAERPDIGLLVPLLYDEDGRHSSDGGHNSDGRLISAGGKNPAYHLQTRQLTFADNQPVQPVETVSGTAAFTQAALWRTVGLLDEQFFFSTEMADLSLRAAKSGFGAAVERRAKATHRTERSVHLRQNLYVYYIVRNRLLILKKHYQWYLHLWLLWLGYTAVLALKLRLEGQVATATAVWLALRDGLAGRWGGQNERVLAACQAAEQAA